MIKATQKKGWTNQGLLKLFPDRSRASIQAKLKQLKGKTKSEKPGKNNHKRWTDEENKKFSTGIKRFGNDFEKIAKLVGTRSASAIETYAMRSTRYGRHSKFIKQNFKTLGSHNLALWTESE